MVDRKRFDRNVRLLDIYGKVLSQAEFEVARDSLYYELSLSEIASQRNISRQAVEKQLKNALAKMERLEKQVGFLRFVDKIVDALPQSEKEIPMKILEENSDV
ncbi:hypothetical protein [Coprothermobacter platensis]|uniref:hypothetical protein n=1 Tax=Coprothermobacter platensis TaxID=108819 RepID=UPI0003685C98|nr:hypothetical protein [Coprothermobacter platensis]